MNSNDEDNKTHKKELSQVTTFQVPFIVNRFEENVILYTKDEEKLSKEQIIKKAIKLHLQGNISEAEKYYQHCLKQGYSDSKVYSNYAIILKSHGKFKEAEVVVRKAIELNPYSADAYCNLGDILNSLSKLKEAELSTRKAIEIKPNYYIAHYNLGTILRALGKAKDAKLSTQKAIELKPDFPEAHNNLGSILIDLGRLKDAESSYSKAISLKPSFTSALMNRWQLLFDNREFEKALKDVDSCNTKLSRACSLETLYALGRIEEIYLRINNSSKNDDENIRLAAFSSFISAQKKKDISNCFCQKPLSFLYFSNLKLSLDNYINLTKEIINELNGVETIWEPFKNTTHNGFHTPQYINLFLNTSGKLSQLKSIISDELDAYYSKFEKESCSFIKKWPSKKNLVAWHVILKKQGYQEAHIHPDGWLSGVIYLKVVPPLDKNEGAIEFSLNGVNYYDKNSAQLTFQPKVGDIILFPSSLFHRTIPFSTDTDRIVIAFDLMPESYEASRV